MAFGIDDAFLAGAGSSLLDFGLGQASSAISWKRQKKVLKNQIQWRVQDMKKAGLNPILAVSPGAGGSAGAVPMGPTGSGVAENVSRLAGAGASSAAAGKSRAETSRTQALMEAELEALRAANMERTAAAAKHWQDAKTGKSNQALIDIERALRESEVPSAKALKEFDESTAGQLMQKWNRILNQSGLASVLGGTVGGVLGGAASRYMSREKPPVYMQPGSNRR